MAIWDQRHVENASGKFFVDFSCIACDTCTGIAKDVFELTLDKDHAFVKQQPRTQQGIQDAQDAMYACPVNAIGIQWSNQQRNYLIDYLPLS